MANVARPFWPTTPWFDYNAVLDFDQGDVREREAIREHEQQLANEELRLAYEGDRLNGVVGLYYGIHKNDINDQINLKLAGVDDPALVADGDVRIRNAAVFGEANWEFVDRWQLHGGLRYDREKNETEFNYTCFWRAPIRRCMRPRVPSGSCHRVACGVTDRHRLQAVSAVE
jgi:outer membrane receptor protein involved in Fe transport